MLMQPENAANSVAAFAVDRNLIRNTTTVP